MKSAIEPVFNVVIWEIKWAFFKVSQARSGELNCGVEGSLIYFFKKTMNIKIYQKMNSIKTRVKGFI